MITGVNRALLSRLPLRERMWGGNPAAPPPRSRSVIYMEVIYKEGIYRAMYTTQWVF